MWDYDEGEDEDRIGKGGASPRHLIPSPRQSAFSSHTFHHPPPQNSREASSYVLRLRDHWFSGSSCRKSAIPCGSNVESRRKRSSGQFQWLFPMTGRTADSWCLSMIGFEADLCSIWVACSDDLDSWKGQGWGARRQTHGSLPLCVHMTAVCHKMVNPSRAKWALCLYKPTQRCWQRYSVSYPLLLIQYILFMSAPMFV